MLETSQDAVLSLPATFVHAALVETYISAGLIGLIVWEHLITFGEEVRLVWQRKLSLVTVLFAITRYGVLVYCILAFSSGFARGDPVCNFITRATEVTILLLVLAVGTFSIIRVFALSGRSMRLLVVMIGLRAVPFTINVYIYTVTTPAATGVTMAACLAHLSSHRNILWVPDAARGAAIVADIITLTVTLMRTVQTQRDANAANIRVPLTTVFLRDGTIVFLTAITMNIAYLTVYHISGQRYLFTIICALTAVLTSRFFLDIREAAMGGPRTGNSISDELVQEWGASTAQDIIERHTIEFALSMHE